MISRIIKVSVSVISLSVRLRLIPLTSTLIIPDITKTSSNNCLLFPLVSRLGYRTNWLLRLGELLHMTHHIKIMNDTLLRCQNNVDKWGPVTCIFQSLLLRFFTGKYSVLGDKLRSPRIITFKPCSEESTNVSLKFSKKSMGHPVACKMYREEKI